ncbi:hypothetical protein MINTM015_11560 [Mycobacterium paraintracellulare]|nr:hypothetical protein MINTM015_11560 [Mycobacterium paraintracellulare]
MTTTSSPRQIAPDDTSDGEGPRPLAQMVVVKVASPNTHRWRVQVAPYFAVCLVRVSDRGGPRIGVAQRITRVPATLRRSSAGVRSVDGTLPTAGAQ